MLVVIFFSLTWEKIAQVKPRSVITSFVLQANEFVSNIFQGIWKVYCSTDETNHFDNLHLAYNYFHITTTVF